MRDSHIFALVQMCSTTAAPAHVCSPSVSDLSLMAACVAAEFKTELLVFASRIGESSSREVIPRSKQAIADVP